MQIITHSSQETRSLGEKLAGLLKANDVLVLRGDMGAGKSELTRGIGKGLGIDGYITSPTFTILQVHEGGRLPLYHFDWYRIADESELYELSLDEYLHMGGVAVVEWPVRAENVLPADYIEITIQPLSEAERRFDFHSVGKIRAMDWPTLEREEIPCESPCH